MDADIALILTQDGIVTGAIYALLGLAVVLVFTVTRELFLPPDALVVQPDGALAREWKQWPEQRYPRTGGGAA